MVSKELGQHWLYSREILDKIADLAAGFDGKSEGIETKKAPKKALLAAGEGPKSLCVEIGPGLGTLTAALLRRFERVLAVEFDGRLAGNLPGSFPGKNLTVVNEDILKFDFSAIPQPYSVAGNIPYYITSPIIENLLTAQPLPEVIVLLMQKEVAERVCDEKESVLSLFVKNRAEVELGPVVPKEEFTPVPKVDSQILILKPFKNGPKYDEKLMDFVKLAFKNPRKKLKHNIPNVPEKYANLRPADLHLDDYHRLTEQK